MNARVKMFTYISGGGSTVLEPSLEDHVNDWLAAVDGELIRVTQSESERQGTAHITLCIWYTPRTAAAAGS